MPKKAGVQLPKLRKPPVAPTGPRLYRPLDLRENAIGGPGKPPDNFLTPSNSLTEWYAYWGLGIIYDNPDNVRQPPYEGGWPDWVYQKMWDGGRESPGGSVIDFVVYAVPDGKMPVAIRVVTEYWHLYTTNEKKVQDEEQKTFLEDDFEVVDIYDQDFINDPSGAAVIRTLKNALGLMERPNPLWLGTTLRGSRMDLLGGV